MRFLPILRLAGRKGGCFIMELSRRDKLLVENGLFYEPRPVRDAIWVEVIWNIKASETRACMSSIPTSMAGRRLLTLRARGACFGNMG